jgi:hypothetical protein
MNARPGLWVAPSPGIFSGVQLALVYPCAACCCKTRTGSHLLS